MNEQVRSKVGTPANLLYNAGCNPASHRAGIQPMSFTQLIPANRGGAGKRQPPGGRFGKDGQFSINHNAAEFLGEPETILVYAAEKAPALRIRPATATDRGAWLLTGGGTTQHNIKLVTLSKSRPELIGSYTATLRADGLHLVQIVSAPADGRPPAPIAIDTSTLSWRQVLPSAQHQRRNHPSQIQAPARITPNGLLILAGGGPRGAVEQLGTPACLLIFADTTAQQLRIEPGIAADPNAWKLSGAGIVQRRVSLSAFVKANPNMIGEYTVSPVAHGLLLRRKP